MKKTLYFLISGTLALSLLAATPAFAAEASLGGWGQTALNLGLNNIHLSDKQNATTSVNDQKNKNDDSDKSTSDTQVMIVGTVSAINGTTINLSGKDGTTYSVNASGVKFSNSDGASITLSDVQVGDTLAVRGTLSGSTITAEKVADYALRARLFLSAIGAVGAGVVTSVNGSTFTIKPVGTKATTTVTTDSTTAFRLNGQATTSDALSVGSHVIITGTSTSDTSISASLVNIINIGLGFLKHFFFR